MALKSKTSEAAVGFFVLVGLAMLGGLIMKFGRFGDDTADTYQIHVIFDDAAGLIKGSEVHMGGTKIGFITTAPALTNDLKVAVGLAVSNDVQIALKSKFTISSVGFLGDKLVEITPPLEKIEGYLKPSAMVIGNSGAALEDIQDDAAAIAKETLSLIRKANNTVDNLNGTLENIRDATETLNSSFLSETNRKNYADILTNIHTFTTDFAASGKQIQPTITEIRQAVTSINRTAKTAEVTFQTANEELKALRPAINEIPPTIRQLASTTKKAGQAIDKIQNGNGLIKTLTNDQKVATDTKTFVTNLKRYGILRYRDDETEPKKDPRKRYKGKRR